MTDNTDTATRVISITALHDNGDGTFTGVPERPIRRWEEGVIVETKMTDEKGNCIFTTGKIFDQDNTSAPPVSIDKFEITANLRRFELM